MSENLCYVDAYLASLEASIREVQPAEAGRGALVVLDRTVAYPGAVANRPIGARCAPQMGEPG